MTKPPSSSDPSERHSASPSKGGPSTSGGARTKKARGAISQRSKLGGSVKPKKSPQAMAVSVLLHVVVAVVMLQLLTFGHGISSFLNFGNSKNQKEERVTFINTEPKKPAPVRPTKRVAKQTAPQAANPNVVATSPVEVLSGNPAPPSRADTGSGGRSTGTGNGVGAIDPNLRGVKPDYGDSRVWQGPVGNGVAPGRNGADRLDSIMGYAIATAKDSLDSLARAQGKYDRKPGDWTKTDKDGNKWGWDGTGIRLGKVVIPNALLALLPMNAQKGMSGNYTEMERERRLALSRTDIQRMSERALGEKEFRQIANDLRDRRERERRDRLKAPSATVAPAAPTTTPPNKSGGELDWE